MLLLTRNSAIRKTKFKPRQWGPLSAVRSAVFHNAERLGIDPQSIVALWPFWEGGGYPTDIIGKYNVTATTGGVWDAYSWNGNNDTITPVPQVLANEPWTFISELIFREYVYSTQTYLLYHYNATGRVYFSLTASGNSHNISITLGDSAESPIYTTPYIAGPAQHVVITDGSNAYVYFRGDNIISYQYTNLNNTSTDMTLNRASTYDPTFSVAFMVLLGCIISDDSRLHLQFDPYALIRPVARPFVFDVGAGGTVYDVSVLDGVKLGDVLGVAATFNVGVQDGVSLGDTGGGAAQFNVTLIDGTVVGDTTVSTADFVASLVDGVTFGDTVGVDVGIVLTVTDGVAFGDAAGVQQDAVVNVMDGVTLGDALSAAAVLNVLLNDGVLFGDSTGYAGLTYDVSVTDGVKLGDLPDATRSILASLIDGIKVSDTPSVRVDFTVNVSDTVQLGDVVAAIAQFAVVVTDGFKVGDTPRFVVTSDGVVITIYAKNRVWRFEVKSKLFHLDVKQRG